MRFRMIASESSRKKGVISPLSKLFSRFSWSVPPSPLAFGEIIEDMRSDNHKSKTGNQIQAYERIQEQNSNKNIPSDELKLVHARRLFEAGIIQKAAVLGLPEAQAALAKRLLLAGPQGNDADAKLAVKYAKRAAGGGDPQGLRLLGICYRHGLGRVR